MSEPASGSVPFDQAVEYYDRTRALPPDVHGQVVDQLAGELAGRGRALEVGIGTGRIGLSLAESGIPLTGIDLSRPMLERLVANASGASPVAISQADVTRLPFADHTFGAAMASHVLHLVPDWERALAEMARAVRPGGVVLTARGNMSGELRDLVDHVARAAGITGRLSVGVDDPAEVDAAAASLGLVLRELEPVPHTRYESPKRALDFVASNQMSWTWGLDPAVLGRAVEEGRRMAEERWGDLDRTMALDVPVVWRAYDVPS